MIANPANLLLELAERRKKLRMPLITLCNRSGLSRATVCRLLRGDYTKARFTHIVDLAEALGVTFSFHAEKLETLLDQQAERQARRIVRLVQGNMALESQGVDDGTLTKMVSKTKYDLLTGSNKDLWYE